MSFRPNVYSVKKPEHRQGFLAVRLKVSFSWKSLSAGQPDPSHAKDGSDDLDLETDGW